MYYSSSCQLDKWVMILTPFFRPGNKNSEILSNLQQITQLLIWTVFKFQRGIPSTTLQAVHQLSLINTWTRISLSDHLVLLWKMHRGLTGTGNTLVDLIRKGQESMFTWQCVRRVDRRSRQPEGGAPGEYPVSQETLEEPNSLHPVTTRWSPQECDIPRRGSCRNGVWPPHHALCWWDRTLCENSRKAWEGEWWSPEEQGHWASNKETWRFGGREIMIPSSDVCVSCKLREGQQGQTHLLLTLPSMSLHLTYVTSSILTRSLWDRQHYLQFRDGETEAQSD